MQEVRENINQEHHKDNTHTNFTSLILMFVFAFPIILPIITADWTEIDLISGLIIFLMLTATIIGVWKVCKQLVTVIKEGADTDYRER